MQKYVIFADGDSFKNLLKIKIIEKLEMIVIIQANTEAQ